MFRNGLNPRGAGVGMDGAALRANLAAHVNRTLARLDAGEDAAHPDQLGAAMVLEARGNVYGDVRRVDPVKVAANRRRNKAARAARRATR